MKHIDFTQGTNALGPSNKARNAIRRLVRHVAAFSPEQLNHLKGYIAGREGVDEACVSFGCGSTAILNTILELTQAEKNTYSLSVFPETWCSFKETQPGKQDSFTEC